MLSREDNELLCRVGPGTPMGNLHAPVLDPGAHAPSELPAPDCPPVRVRAAGREPHRLPHHLRRSRPRSQNACPHRGASMFFGRNEEEGLRCVYHGWKFDVDRRLRRHAVRAGREQLQEQGARPRLPAASSATASSGPTWARARRRRRCPTSRPTCCRDGEYAVQNVLRECNWMQALEGDIDTSHLAFLHFGAVQPEDTDAGHLRLLQRHGPRAALRRHRHASSARPTAPTARRRTTRTTGASPTSSSPSTR